jgi:hypothetical protein
MGVPSASRYVNFEVAPRLGAALVNNGGAAFDILRTDAGRRQTHIGHKLTKIVSRVRRQATEL